MNKDKDLQSLVSEAAVDRDVEIPVFPFAVREATATELEDAITLCLQDLLPDSHGDVVLEDGLGGLIIVEGGEVAEQGILEESHVTHAGQDVSGMAYARFADGITLYYDSQSTVEFT